MGGLSASTGTRRRRRLVALCLGAAILGAVALPADWADEIAGWGLGDRLVLLHQFDARGAAEAASDLKPLEGFILGHAGVVHILVVPGEEEAREGWRARIPEAWRDRLVRVAPPADDRDGAPVVTRLFHGAAGDVGQVRGVRFDEVHLDRVARLLRQVTAFPEAGAAWATPAGVALHGWDVVALARGVPEEGRPDCASWHRGLTYRFASEGARSAFAAEPERYVPAFGGWCAWAMLDGIRTVPDPRRVRVTPGGRLLLFAADRRAEPRSLWAEGPEAEQLARADAQWRALLAE